MLNDIKSILGQIQKAVMHFFFSLLTIFISKSVSLTFVNPESCALDQYFDSSQLICKQCPPGSRATADHQSCSCDEKHKKTQADNQSKIECTPCSEGQIASVDGWGCIGQISDTNTCQLNEARSFRQTNGLLLPKVTCMPCVSGTHPRPDSTVCIPCDQIIYGSQCLCEPPNVKIDGICVNPNDLVTDSPNLYIIHENGLKIETTFFRNHLRIAEYMCRKFQNQTACQLLGNLCALLHYKRGEKNRGYGRNACDLFLRITRDDNEIFVEWNLMLIFRSQGMPWLYYFHDSAEHILSKSDIPVQYSFESENRNSSFLNFMLAAYSLTGEYLGMLPATDGSLQLCMLTRSSRAFTFQVGKYYMQQVCVCRSNFKIVQYWYRIVEGITRCNLKYDSFENVSAVELYPVPVLNLNYEEESGYPNKIANAPWLWHLNRRIWLIDMSSTKESSVEENRLVRYAKRISIQTTVQLYNDGKIVPPLFTIEYSSISLESLKNGKTMPITFEVVYIDSEDNLSFFLKIILTVSVVLCVVLAIFRSWTWAKQTGKRVLDFAALIKFIVAFCSFASTIVYCIIVAASFYTLMIHKSKRHPHVLMPSFEGEKLWILILVVAFAFKVVDMVLFYIEQITSEVFFIDWEKPRPAGSRKKEASSSASMISSSASTVSIWRLVLHFESLASVEPGFQLEQISNESCDTSLSRLAIVGSLYFIVWSVQCIFHVLITEQCFWNQFRYFIDLCSVCNISVLALRYRLYGYYLHGRSVHGFAEADMDEIHEMLRREKENLCEQRGLEPNSKNQIFTVCLQSQFRKQYDDIFDVLVTAVKTKRMHNGKSLSTIEDEQRVKAFYTMNKFLINFIDHCIADLPYLIKDKLFTEALLNCEFQDTSNCSIFYRDPSEIAFSSLFFYGNEAKLMLFDLMLFTFVDMIAKNYTIAAFVAYIVTKSLKIVRKSGGRKNIARTIVFIVPPLVKVVVVVVEITSTFSSVFLLFFFDGQTQIAHARRDQFDPGRPSPLVVFFVLAWIGMQKVQIVGQLLGRVEIVDGNKTVFRGDRLVVGSTQHDRH
ncbi:Meckelin [Trichinella murrelli]|uniref:Meckelin n=1 Tax=Trichinella murrelli TaxID=144512 RepID=A0A0V0TFX9_9BILA|nr:Meckelin [Trichinella murrelli]